MSWDQPWENWGLPPSPNIFSPTEKSALELDSDPAEEPVEEPPTITEEALELRAGFFERMQENLKYLRKRSHERRWAEEMVEYKALMGNRTAETPLFPTELSLLMQWKSLCLAVDFFQNELNYARFQLPQDHRRYEITRQYINADMGTKQIHTNHVQAGRAIKALMEYIPFLETCLRNLLVQRNHFAESLRNK